MLAALEQPGATNGVLHLKVVHIILNQMESHPKTFSQNSSSWYNTKLAGKKGVSTTTTINHTRPSCVCVCVRLFRVLKIMNNKAKSFCYFPRFWVVWRGRQCSKSYCPHVHTRRPVEVGQTYLGEQAARTRQTHITHGDCPIHSKSLPGRTLRETHMRKLARWHTLTGGRSRKHTASVCVCVFFVFLLAHVTGPGWSFAADPAPHTHTHTHTLGCRVSLRRRVFINIWSDFCFKKASEHKPLRQPFLSLPPRRVSVCVCVVLLVGLFEQVVSAFGARFWRSKMEKGTGLEVKYTHRTYYYSSSPRKWP